jgi:hypothetical protein
MTPITAITNATPPASHFSTRLIFIRLSYGKPIPLRNRWQTGFDSHSSARWALARP